MSLNVSNLGHNLQNIYAGTYNKELESERFVANLSGDLIYDSSRGLGRFWRIFYQVICLFLGEQFKARRLKAAVEKTHQLFHQQLQHIQLHMEKFLKYLGAKCEGFPVPEADIEETRSAITAWNDSTRSFLKIAMRNKNQVLTDFLQAHLGQDSLNKGPFFENALFPTSGYYQDLIDLEGALGEPTPYLLLKKAAKAIPLSVDEDVQMHAWIKKLNLYAAENPEGRTLIHRAFQSFIAHLESHHASLFTTKASYGELAAHLIDLDCSFFQLCDPRHIQWRERLKPNSILSCNGQKITLGEQIGQKRLGEDNVVTFHIQGESEHVLVAGINPATLALRKKWFVERNAWNIKIVAMRWLHDLGRFAIMEKLKDPMEGTGWASVGANLLSEDERRCLPMIGFLERCCKMNCTPLAFSPRYVMLDKEGRMTYAKMLQVPSASQRQFNFNALEDFAFKASMQNRLIFSVLMQKSGLSQLRLASFYQLLVKNAFEGTHLDVELRYHAFEIHDISVLARGKEIYDRAQQLMLSCVDNLRSDHPLRATKTFEKVVGEQLLRHYQESCAAGILWPSLESDVIEALH